jgi:Protein of unknown function (DUF2905)
MVSTRELGRLLIIAGIVLGGIGAVLYFSGRLPFRLGRMPGDISWQGKHGSFYFPVVTCVVLSVILSALFWLISYLRR